MRSRSVNHLGCRKKETSWTVTTEAALVVNGAA